VTALLPTDGTYSLGLLLGGSLRLLWPQRVALLRAAALPLALLLLQALLSDRAPLQVQGEAGATVEAEDPQAETGGLVPLLLAFLGLYAIALFSVAWYRFLLGYGRPSLWPGLNLTQLRFFGRFLLLLLAPVAPVLLLDLLGFASVVIVLACMGLYYFSLRCSLVLPAAAAGVPLSLRQSWRATRGKVLPLLLAPLFGSLVIASLVATPLLLLAGLFIEPGGGPPGPFAAFLLWLEVDLVALLAVAQGAAVLAIAVVRLVPDPRTA
jgi:hypothetical protein